MESNKEQKEFTYTYSAKQQEEIRKIREKYTPPMHSENKMEQLRRMDAAITAKATKASLTLGIIGALVMGLGMSLCMTDLNRILGFYCDMAMLIGIAVGIIGIILVCFAYPIYNRIIREERKKIAPVILQLTNELMN